MKTADEFRFTDPAVQRNRIDYFAAMRRGGPVYHEPITGAYFITRASDIRWAAEHHEIFSNVTDPSKFRVCMGGEILERTDPEIAQRFKDNGWLEPFTLLLNDPPTHGFYRGLANLALSPKNIKTLQPFIQEQTDRLIANFSPDGKIDFVKDFGNELPMSIIGHFFSAPREDWPMIKRWADQFFDTQVGEPGKEAYLKTVDGIIEMQHYVYNKIQELKKAPRDNVLYALMTAHEELGTDPLSLEEIMSICHVFMVAGHDTTAQTLGNCLRVIAEFPEVANSLRENPGKIGDFISEVLRMYSPANLTPRFTTRDVEISGAAIPKDSTVFLVWGSGNRDEEKYQCPNRFNMNREEKDHFGFGYGIHFCVGSRLAKTTLKIAIQTLLLEFKSIRLRIPIEKIEYKPLITHWTLERLPLEVSRD